MTIVPPSGEVPKNIERTVDGDRIPSTSNQELNLLESDVPVSQSLIWKSQREFYAQRGLKSWTEDMVPQFITNNPFFAEIYARIVFAFICDCRELERNESRPLSPLNPLRILELGAGPGKFAFLFLRQLQALLQAQNISLNIVRYCMTDCSESLIQSWRTNEYLRKFVEPGILEFEKLDAGGEITSDFLARDASQPRGSLIVIANYVFDSLPHDAFVIKEGRVFELLQTTTMVGQGVGGAGVEGFSSQQFSYKDVEIGLDHYPDQTWNSILELYRLRLTGATVVFPSKVLATLQAICKFTDGAMLILAADKGCAHEGDLQLFRGDPTFEFHSKYCFSQMVNFDAISKYFQAVGGEALLPDKHSTTLNICAFLQDRKSRQVPDTKARYQEAQSAFGSDDLFGLLAWLNPHIEEMSIPQILSLLRLSRWDPTTLVRLFPVIVRQIRAVFAERDDLRDAVRLTWANHFPINTHDNMLAFYCGVILLELRFFEEAFVMLTRSQELLGRSAATSYNLGLCLQGLGRSEESLAFMTEACLLGF
jgi:hypothetical protein